MNFPAYAPPYAPQYAAPYVPTYAPQHAIMAYTGQAPGAPAGAMTPAGAATTAPTDKPGITTKAWWMETNAGFPRWALAAGAVALGTIGYGWSAGWFDTSGTTVKRSTSRSSRDAGRKRTRRTRKASPKRRGRRDHKSHALSSGARYDWDF